MKNKTINNSLLNPDNCTFMLIDHQPQMVFGVQSIDRQTLRNNVTALAKTAAIFNIPTILTTIEAQSFSGQLLSEIQKVFPQTSPLDRSSMNAWEDKKVTDAVQAAGRKKLVMAALWTEICLAFPVLSALEENYEVYFVVDASGGFTTTAHDMAVQRMIQAGAIPMTWLQVLCELQRDWSRKQTYNQVTNLIKEHAGAYGVGISYRENLVTSK
jgi:nicotinamidase-related amidase